MKTIHASLVLGACALLINCSWPIGAEHPHRITINTSVNDNPRTHPSLRSEWRKSLGLKGAFVTSQGFIGGVAVHPQYPLVASVGFDNELLYSFLIPVEEFTKRDLIITTPSENINSFGCVELLKKT